MSGYEAISFEPGLWTVGFCKTDGTWEPVSDHRNRDRADRRADWLNGKEPDHVYLKTESGLWTTGAYDWTTGAFHPLDDWDNEEDAMRETARLNGSKVPEC